MLVDDIFSQYSSSNSIIEFCARLCFFLDKTKSSVLLFGFRIGKNEDVIYGMYSNMLLVIDLQFDIRNWNSFRHSNRTSSVDDDIKNSKCSIPPFFTNESIYPDIKVKLLLLASSWKTSLYMDRSSIWRHGDISNERRWMILLIWFIVIKSEFVTICLAMLIKFDIFILRLGFIIFFSANSSFSLSILKWLSQQYLFTLLSYNFIISSIISVASNILFIIFILFLYKFSTFFQSSICSLLSYLLIIFGLNTISLKKSFTCSKYWLMFFISTFAIFIIIFIIS